jgi:hypothetical protein
MSREHRQQTIIRAPRDKENPYFSTRRASAQDVALSFEARGVMWYLLSKPGNWQISKAQLMKEGGCGRDKMHRILKELQDTGYLQSDQTRQDEGKFGASEYVLYECPQEKPPTENPLTEKALTAEAKPSTGKPSTDKPSTVNPQHTDKRFKQKIESEQSSDSPKAGESPAPPDAGGTTKRPRSRDPVYDMVAEVWFEKRRDSAGFEALGGRIGPHVAWLKQRPIKVTRNNGVTSTIEVPGCTYAVTPDLLMRAKRAWESKYPGIHLPTDILKFVEFLDGWLPGDPSPDEVSPLKDSYRRADPACPICGGNGLLLDAAGQTRPCSCLEAKAHE